MRVARRSSTDEARAPYRPQRLAAASALVASVLVAVLPPCADAQAPPSSSSSSSSAAEISTAEELAQQWFTSNFDDGETQLAVGVSSALSNLSSLDAVCGGLPSVQRRTDASPVNGACPAVLSSVNASCTCLSGYADVDTWEFRVTKRRATDEAEAESYPAVWDASDVLPIDAIRSLLVPPTLTTLRIIGVGDAAQAVTFVPEDENVPGTALPIATNAQDKDADTAITTMELFNIDMESLILSARAFVPPRTLNLTLRNCNIAKFGYWSLFGMDNVRVLDMSMNKLPAPYVGSTIAKTCSNQFCAVEILNLTGNELTTFPLSVFNLENLQELYIANNSITDFNVSESLFASVASLRAFQADPPSPSAVCTLGTWRKAHGATFCVANATSPIAPAASTSSTSHATLTYAAVACSCVVAILLAVFVWQRFVRPRSDSGRWLSSSKASASLVDSNVGDTFNFDDTREQVDAKYLEDPVVVTNRIEYKQLKVGKCISRGGFGLVFAGDFHGRRVAIKKIRPDRVGNVSEIELFFKEIILMAQLYHPRIVEFIGVAWDVLRHLSAVTEYMDHGDLRNVLYGLKQQGRPLTWEGHKTAIALQIAEAVEYLHSLKPKVIHRDLKSKNVLLNLHLEAKLSDFGISKQRSRMETHLTVGIGTSFWIAPEVLRGEDYDERADIYSFGVVLSEIDTDDYPYWNDANAAGGDDDDKQNKKAARGKLQEAEILGLVGEGKLRPSFSDACPRAILELADCCLQRDPGDRPSATEIVVMLQHILHASQRSSSSASASDSALWLVDH